MEWIQEVTGVEDKNVPALCLTGMPIVGHALSSPFFLPWPDPQQISVEELLRRAPKTREAVLESFERKRRRTESYVLEEVQRKTTKEIDAGTMGSGLTPEEASREYGNFYNVVGSFGLVQGQTAEGRPKVRRIDDHRVR